MNDTITFEEQFEKLRAEIKKIESSETGLTKCIESYDKAVEYYNSCIKLLDECKQRVTIINDNLSNQEQ